MYIYDSEVGDIYHRLKFSTHLPLLPVHGVVTIAKKLYIPNYYPLVSRVHKLLRNVIDECMHGAIAHANQNSYILLI